MATMIHSNGLQHAVSLGHIEVASKKTNIHTPSRCYDSEDETMGRKKNRYYTAEFHPRTSVYSKGDIREQYCLTDKQLNTIDRPRRERIFGCWSGRHAPQSFLGVCVGRRAPSDENLAEYAPFYKYPRYHTHDVNQYDEDIESSYFRRRPASILSSGSNTGETKRCTWMPVDEESIRLEGPRPILSEYDDFHHGPYVVGSYQSSRYLSQSTEHLAGSIYRCPAHVGLPPPPPPPIVPVDGALPRTKHVSFARSHTLTSFDEAASLGLRSSGRMNSTRSQERLIGGKKSCLTTGVLHQQQQQQQILQPTVAYHQFHQHPPPLPQISTPQQPQMSHLSSMQTSSNLLNIPQPQMHHQQPEVLVVEKIKRGSMKTQATQTDVYLDRKSTPLHHLSLSPRTIHRVRMVSQGAQTNGMVNGRKLTKSLSEMTSTMGPQIDTLKTEEQRLIIEHEQLHRTQSEEPPRSPSMVAQPSLLLPQPRYFEQIHSRTSSRCSDQVSPGISDHRGGHSRNLSQDSAISHRSMDTASSNIMNTPLNLIRSSEQRPTREHYFSYSTDGNITTESRSTSRLSDTSSAQRVPSISRVDLDQSSGFDYESNSLPRRTCIHHRTEEYHSHSLPRRDSHQAHEICKHVTECSDFLNGKSTSFRSEKLSRENSAESSQQVEKRKASMLPDISPKTHSNLRRQSMPHFVHSYLSPTFQPQKMQSEDESDQSQFNDIEIKLSDKQIEDEQNIVNYKVEEEKEIFIDFKPHISPTVSPRRRRKKLQKTLSDGEILVEKQQQYDSARESLLLASASEEDIKQQQNDENEIEKEYQYQNLPIRDEGIFDKQNLLIIPSLPEISSSSSDTVLRSRREAFRKRSISLEDPMGNDEVKHPKSAPPSPCQEELSVHVQSAYPSTDSLVNDLTRDHSDGIWNESQVTVLTAESRDENNPPLLTPSSKRKHLLLQHQQRSSIDTDVLDIEEQFSSDQSAPHAPPPALKPASTQTSAQTQQIFESSTTVITPSIAVTPTFSIDDDDNEIPLPLPPTLSRRSSRTLSPSLQEKRKIEPLIHTHSPQRLSDTPDISQSLLMARTDSGPKTDISECSTNTDEYATCTDTSKRLPGMKTPTTASSSTSTQIPVSAQSSQTATHEGGSSFESASSLYSTRGDGLSEEIPQTEDMQAIEDPSVTQIIPKKSPSLSISSTSSGSFNITNKNRMKTIIKTSPVQLNASIKQSVNQKKKTESISDDERSERRYSSSGYYESPQDDEHRTAIKHKKTRERAEEERRRRKNNMKLDIERENLRALTSPIKRPSPGFKQISPDDRTALNILDGTSPNKAKRFRPKIRRQLRKTSISRDDVIPRKSTKATSTSKSPENVSDTKIERIIERSPDKSSISCHQQQTRLSPSIKERLAKQTVTDSGSEKRLKAKSVESLRSVSPGSDSVFYSEADAITDQQVHCLHCGKEVEIITAASGSQDSIAALEHDGPDIVKPPADFADSPITTKTSQRLYKKMDKRFRSEERHSAERRHYRNRQENVRAKSEERNKEQSTSSSPILRPAGSSPCVMPIDSAESRRSSGAESDQIVYRGHYRIGLYTRLTDNDVWMQLDHQSFDRHRDRRGSTDSEKAFHQKYQVILHRLIQRRCTLEMYQRQKNNSFKFLTSDFNQNTVRRKLEDILKLMLIIWAREGQALKIFGAHSKIINEIDKTVIVSSDSGEFGFRIHGSKPVVVAAIEPETPAESSGLEVGDIIISVNGIPVLDKHHTEVVKIAHAGCETLELEVARTISVLMNEQQESASPALYTGYLWRQSGQVKGSPNSKKWVRRWFCLRPDYCLYYYKTDSDTQPVGAVILINHTIEHCSPEIGKPHAFKIDSGEGIPMHLAADTQEAADRWVAVMSHASTQSDPWLEMSTRNLRLPANGISRPDCHGYLMKLGNKWCGWSKRYCVLKDACLYFYQDNSSKNASGMACLQGYKVLAMSSNTAGRKNSFEVIPPDTKLRHFYFSAESDMDKKRWISALEYSIDRWIKAG